MIAFEILINEKKELVAGIEDWDFINAIINAKRALKANETDEFEIRIGGIAQQVENDKIEHLRWGCKTLKLGDTVSIRLIDTNKVDPPIKRYRSDRKVQESPFTDEEIYEMKKQTYLELKAMFEGEDDNS
jgi:hypothetical protein